MSGSWMSHKAGCPKSWLSGSWMSESWMSQSWMSVCRTLYPSSHCQAVKSTQQQKSTTTTTTTTTKTTTNITTTTHVLFVCQKNWIRPKTRRISGAIVPPYVACGPFVSEYNKKPAANFLKLSKYLLKCMFLKKSDGAKTNCTMIKARSAVDASSDRLVWCECSMA